MHKWNARRNFRSVMTMRNPTTPPKPLTHPSSDRDPSRTLSSLVFTGQGIQSTGPFNVSGNIIINQNGNVANVREAEADRKREELEKKRKELEKKRKELERKRKELEKKHKHRQALLKTLQFDQMDSRQLTIQKEYPKTCKWFLQDEAYCEWMRNQESGDAGNFLWIKGKPGAGKSTMMKFLLEYTRRNKRGPKVISFFFNARGDTMEKNTLGLYRSLVVQLLELYPALLSVLDKYRSSIKWNVNSAKGLFSETVEALGKIPVICFIDALDECKEQEVRDMIACLSGLCEIGKKLNICLASRHYPNITIMKGRSIVLEDKVEHQRDIADYIDSTLCIRNESALGEIRSDLLKKASGVFMWVVLVVNILNKAYDTTGLRGLRKRLADIPDDLDTLFRDMLSRDTINTPNLLLCIQWVLFARRPLKPMELYLAIISASKPENLADYHAGDITDDEIAKFVLDTSKGLAELTKSEHPTIQFIHESLLERASKGKATRC
ncbi:hypothetical protein MCOR25_005353 [Pyricularia grisea]|uniref:Nephrocystin 3-like N-terminal domain-containing protein n=1 Tax=Pyricularia grisea TaxID=148305 RepID=A0A6P8AXK6_PYRGI|nr:hypothetical protein PgNI_10769 [Pyricularia grisea]KAI6365426.1 hypothetical protein MCOR25_005353 [Pyricularia grisea]TLD07029.1 hypothetical protein PgNI_10769 [Pyricularia grisea]